MNATKITPSAGKIHGLRVILDQVYWFIINLTRNKEKDIIFTTSTCCLISFWLVTKVYAKIFFPGLGI